MFVCRGGPGYTPLFGGVANESTLGPGYQVGSGCPRIGLTSQWQGLPYSFDGTNLKGFRYLLLSEAYASSMWRLVIGFLSIRWPWVEWCVLEIGPGQTSRDRQRSVCGVVCSACMVHIPVGCCRWHLIYLDSVQTHLYHSELPHCRTWKQEDNFVQ